MARPKRPLISRESAVRAALNEIDEKGLDSFNLGNVARRMGVSAPSLYHHFTDKSEILAEVARLVLDEADEGRVKGHADWREAVIQQALATRRSILRHPNTAPLILMHPPRRVALISYERMLRLLDSQGVPQPLQMAILIGTENILFGSALLNASVASRGENMVPPFDADVFPHIARQMDLAGEEDEALFVRMLQALFDGLCGN